MAAKHHHCLISGRHNFAAISLIVFNLFAAAGAQTQSPPNENNNNRNDPDYDYTSAKFSASTAIIIVVILGAFFIIGIFSIYIRRCGADRMNPLTASAAAGARSRRHQGLDPTILETIPTLVYAEVKQHKVGKGALECAICLNEFEDEDTIRLLPKCDHVFHQDCIDAWLATHVTCPVCRANYAFNSADAPPIPVAVEVGAAQNPAAAPPPEMDDGERKQEMKELARMASKMRRNGSKRGGSLPRWHSTGHSMAQQAGGLDRYTLRLPEEIRKDVIASGMLQRGRSLAVAVTSVIGEDSGRRGRSGRHGRSVSGKIPAAFGLVKEGSLRGKFAGGGFFKKNLDYDSESSTAALNRV